MEEALVEGGSYFERKMVAGMTRTRWNEGGQGRKVPGCWNSGLLERWGSIVDVLGQAIEAVPRVDRAHVDDLEVAIKVAP